MRYMNFVILIQIRKTIEAVVGHGDYLRCGCDGTRSDIGRDDVKECGLLRFWVAGHSTKTKKSAHEHTEQGYCTFLGKRSQYDNA